MFAFLIISLVCLIVFSCSAHTEKEISSVVTNLNDESKKDTSFTDQLKHLQDLYKSGVISGYEYENEKKKLLIK